MFYFTNCLDWNHIPNPTSSQTSFSEPSYCQTCGGTLTEPSGMIEARTSPTGRYLPDENCIWRIKRNKTEKIMITIIRFYAHSEDFLYIKNGLTNQTLHSYSSNMSVKPKDGYSLPFNTHNLVIQFISNRTLQRIGFKLNYTAFTPPRSKRTFTFVIRLNGKISYPNNNPYKKS